MEVKLHIPDDMALRLSADGADVSRRALEALALDGYRDQTLTLYQVSEMLGLSRIETEDFLGRHHVSLSTIEEADLDREAAIFEGDWCATRQIYFETSLKRYFMYSSSPNSSPRMIRIRPT
jgi:hypothetical protein